MLSKQQVAHEL